MIDEVCFRAATPDDVAAVVPLIHSSGPAAFEYVFAVPGRGGARDFLARAFVDGAGEFGWRNHCVGELDGRVVAAGAGFGGESMLAFTLAAARQIFGHYRLQAPGVVARGLRVERVIQPPTHGMHYLAHLGVAPELRGQGIGHALVAHLIEQGRAQGKRRMVLDVAATNPLAQALYQRLGFVVTGERDSTLANAQGAVPAHRRMERMLPE